MGDIADMIYDQMVDGFLDWRDDDDAGGRDACVKCRYCGCHAWWRRKAEGWRLYNAGGELHNCRVTAAAPDEFADLTKEV